MMNGAYNKWKQLVDEQLLIITKKYSDMSNPNEDRNKVIITNLISDLTKEMSKKSEW